MMYKYIKLSLLTFLFLFSFSCSDFLEVENMNDPDTQGVLSSPEGIKALNRQFIQYVVYRRTTQPLFSRTGTLGHGRLGNRNLC